MQKLTSLFLYYTWNCNLKCAHCWVYGGETYSGCLGRDKAIEVCTEAVDLGAQFIKISGGEPLMYSDDVIAIAETVKDKYPFVALCLETNATLVTPLIANKLNCFDSISVSLDSADASMHDSIRGQTGAFEKAVSGIKYLRERGINVSITSVIGASSDIAAVDGIVELARSLGVERIKLNPIMNIGRAYGKEKSFYSISPLKMLEIRSRYVSYKDIEVCLMMPCAYNIDLVSPEKSRLHSCDCLSLLSILPDGDVGLCGEARFLPEFHFGNCYGTSLQEIWNYSNQLAVLRDTVPSKLTGVCGKCVIRHICKGSCRVEGFMSGGSLDAPSYICQYMYDRHLFHLAK